jgi:SAM-dependent methyltransferase
MAPRAKQGSYTMIAAIATNDADHQAEIDAKNRIFWDELCGSALAQSLGVTDSSPKSLAKFDAWYMAFYPYLIKYVPFTEINGKKVLEVGLGYGTISQKLAEAGADYTGLDIAAGPVTMVNHRLAQSGLPGKAIQARMLECPLPDNSMDHLVAIGCFHHTGNLQRAIDEAWRVLKPGGQAIIMVYYAYSYRRWRFNFRETFRHLIADKLGVHLAQIAATDRERAHYDASTKYGVGAPETAFTSVSDMRRLARHWTSCRINKENIGQESVFAKWSRAKACRIAGPWLGLDIYCSLVK